MPWRALLGCLPHAPAERAGTGPRLPAQVAERVCCPLHGLQARVETLGCPHHPSKLALMTTRVTLASTSLGAQEWEEGTSQPLDGFSEEGLEKDEEKTGGIHLLSCPEKLRTPLRLSARDLHKQIRIPKRAFPIRGEWALWRRMSTGPGLLDLFVGSSGSWVRKSGSSFCSSPL